jgi:hypothetical protein
MTTGSAWNKADLLFLVDALMRGAAEDDVANFLGRSTDEVREQADMLKRRRHPDSPTKRNSANSQQPTQRGNRREGQ